MRVVVNTSCAVAGGAVTHLRNLLPHLAAHFESHELVVVGDARTRDQIGLPPGVVWHETPAISGGLVQRLWFENVVLPGLLGDLNADVLFHPANFGSFRPGVPQVILVHNLAPFLDEVISGESTIQKIRLALLRWLTNVSLRASSNTIFISRWGRSLVLGNSTPDERRMPVIGFGAEHATQSWDDEFLLRYSLQPDRYALTVSHLYRYKKIEKLIEAYETLGDRVADTPLLIVGSPFDREYADRLKKHAAESNVPVIFTGALGAKDLATLMKHCRVFLFSSEAENLPITLLEAMSAKCAIVTNRACSMPEVCGDAVAYADPARASEYARQIESVLEDEERRQDLRIRAEARSRSYSWARAAEETAAVLRAAAAHD